MRSRPERPSSAGRRSSGLKWVRRSIGSASRRSSSTCGWQGRWVVGETAALVRSWAEGRLPHDVQNAIERLARSEDVRRIAIMPDVHLSADVCVGTVVGTTRTLYPNAVGGDIGCGVAAIAFDGEASALQDERAAAAVLAGLYRTVPIVHRSRKSAVGLPAGLASRPLSAPALEALKRREGPLQLGTLGRGNHFVELQADETNRLWLMLHSGSRGMGQAIRDRHLVACRAGRSGLRFLEADSPAGSAYLSDVAWALAYADANRLALVATVCEVVERTLGARADEGSYFARDHNHVRREEHDGETFWVHRKGAMSVPTGAPGVLPG